METTQTQPPSEDQRKEIAAYALEIPVDSITVGERVRTDFGDIEDLAESIKNEGLIQPIVVTSDHRLVAGERRLRAHKKLGLAVIKAVYIDVLDEAHRTILEATENIARKDFDWKEQVLAIDKVHRLKSTTSALRSETWGVRETGRLLKASKSNIGRAVFIASFIRANDPDILKADSLKDAYEVLIKRREDELAKQLVASSAPTGDRATPVKGVSKPAKAVTDDDFFGEVRTTGFIPGIGGPVDLDERPGSPAGESHSVVPLSQMFFNEDSVEFCKRQDPEIFDAVITDWPYGIDMDNLQQDCGGTDVSSTAAEHVVADNEKLHADIVPLLYRLLKPNGWFITWTDVMQWQRNYDLCIAAGFKVQRWPLTWHKTSTCQNMSAQYNFTKNTEIAIVCRKGNATLLRSQASSVWSGGTDAESKSLNHPFAKPSGLWEWILNATCLRGASVLDPFVGAGSSVFPMIRFGVRPTGVEINQKHFGNLMVNVQNFYKSIDPNCKFQ